MILGIVLALLGLVLAASQDDPTPLNVEDTALYQYVYRDDGYFSWYLDKQETVGDVTSYWINVTSQMWKDESFSNWPVWWHWLVVHVPHNPVQTDSAFIYLSHFSNTNSPPSTGRDHFRRTYDIAARTGLITSLLEQIPNQPITFVDDNRGWNRYEDELIAWTWRKFMEDEQEEAGSGDPEIIARFPMCKGAVKAMDAVTELVKRELDYDIEHFMVAGESKRGWTTWMTGAIDSRVIAMAPVVLSCLNMVDNFDHYYKSYGGYPYYFFDYWIENITAWMFTPEMDRLAEYCDPFSYSQWMTMPKYVVMGASDEFFLLDDTHYFWDDLPGEKHMWIKEDTGHSVGSGPRVDEYWNMLSTFFQSVLGNEERPEITWTREVSETGGSVTLHSPGSAPRDIVGFWADSVVPHRRDWRTSMLNFSALPDYIEEQTGIEWGREDVEDLGNGDYRFEMDLPAEGYRAFYITATYDALGGEEDYIFSTEAHVIPPTFPNTSCSTALQCRGWLW